MTNAKVEADPRIRLLQGRRWRGLEANLTAATAGLYVNPPRPDHHLMIHLGAPARVRYREGTRRDAYVQERGDIDVIPAGAAPVFDDDDPTASLSLWVSTSLLAEASGAMASAGRRRLVEPRIKQRDDRILALGMLIKNEVEAPAPSDALFVESLAVALATRLLERFGAAAPVGAGAVLPKAKLKGVLEYIELNLGEEIRLADLAGFAGVSPSHFRALFRQSLRRPLHRYVIERRVCHARELLETGRASIVQAALESGFCHQSHLAKAMRQCLGVSPSEVARGRREPIAAPLRQRPPAGG